MTWIVHVYRSARGSMHDLRKGLPDYKDFCTEGWQRYAFQTDLEPSCTLFARKFSDEVDGELLRVLAGCDSSLDMLTEAACIPFEDES